MKKHFLGAICIFFIFGCSKKKGTEMGAPVNRSPAATISANLVTVHPFTYKFRVEATDRDNDTLTYTWDFGEGTVRTGKAEEQFDYATGKEYLVKVKVSDGKSTPVEVTANVSTKTVDVTVDLTKRFQTMDGFGGFGAIKEYWANGPFTSDQFVSDLITDLGLTIMRDNMPTSFEVENDNNDPLVTDLDKFNLSSKPPGHDETVNDHLDHLKKMHAAGLEKLIVAIWSPAPWMKYNNRVGNGTESTNSAPAYTYAPTESTNQLKTGLYDEFAERCVAYIKIIKQKTGIDIYALSIQNEPRFSQFYASCVYDGTALRDLLKVVGKRFKDEGLSTKLFLPEDVGWLQGVENMIKPTLNDPVARGYADIIAVHGYDLDGVTAGSASAQTWQTMYSWGAPYNKPLWMTETSGYENSYAGAMKLAKAMYTAIRFGNVSAWVFWSLSGTKLDAYTLMSFTGEKSKRYYVSKNFYRYIRPGAARTEINAPDGSNVYPLAFQHNAENATTLVFINESNSGKPIKLSGNSLPAHLSMYVTTEDDNSKDYGLINSSNAILLPANSVVTLYHKK